MAFYCCRRWTWSQFYLLHIQFSSVVPNWGVGPFIGLQDTFWGHEIIKVNVVGKKKNFIKFHYPNVYLLFFSSLFSFFHSSVELLTAQRHLIQVCMCHKPKKQTTTKKEATHLIFNNSNITYCISLSYVFNLKS